MTRLLREEGVLHGALCTDGSRTQEEMIELARNWEGLDGRDLVQEVTCEEPFYWSAETEGEWTPVASGEAASGPWEEGVRHDSPLVVAYDFGMKHNILRRLVSHNLRVAVVPGRYAGAGRAGSGP